MVKMVAGWICRQCRSASPHVLPSTKRSFTRAAVPEARLLGPVTAKPKSQTRTTIAPQLLPVSTTRSFRSARSLCQGTGITQTPDAALAQDMPPAARQAAASGSDTSATTTNSPSSSFSSPSPQSGPIIFSPPPYTSPTHIGRVTRASTMHKTVQVTTTVQEFAKNLQIHYTKPSRALVHDPANILVEGDVIEYGLFPEAERQVRQKMGMGKRVRFVVRGVVTPFGTAVEDRVPKVRYEGPRGKGRGEKEKVAD